MQGKLQKIMVDIPALSCYRHIIVLSQPGIVYVNTCAEEDAMDIIMRDLAA
jgi:hypothetical protein